jgi:hypothetical protein
MTIEISRFTRTFAYSSIKHNKLFLHDDHSYKMMIIPKIDLVWVKGKDNWAAHNMARWAILEPNKE